MISTFVLEKIRTPFVTDVCRWYFRTISSSFAENTKKVKQNVKRKYDKPAAIKNIYVKEKRKCILCELNIEPDYKNIRLLSQFQSRYTGRIYERHVTGLCQHKQKRVEEEILKAQNAGLMGIWSKEPEYVNDPQLFDPNRPFRPHKY